MSDRSLKLLRIGGASVAAIGLVLVLLSPAIGEPISPGQLWWIEPVAYIGAGVFFIGAIALIYSPVSSHPIFLNPTLTCSLAQSLDVDFVGQIIFQDSDTGYGSDVQAFFLRMKWSF